MNVQPSPDALIAEGLAASRQNRTEAAIDLFSRASTLAPGSGLPHFLIGSEHAAAGNFEAAEASFANAIRVAPDFVLARYQLGLLQFSSKRAAVALLTWQPLLSLVDTEPFGHFVRGFGALAQDDFTEALRHYRLGLERSGGNEAVAGDILQIVAKVEEQLVPAAGEEAPAGSSHVLLAGYARGLH